MSNYLDDEAAAARHDAADEREPADPRCLTDAELEAYYAMKRGW